MTRMLQGETDWEKQWSQWDKFYASPIRPIQDWLLNQNFKSLLKDVKLKDGRIIGLGSGTGNTLLIIAKIVKAKEAVFVDREKKAFEINQKLLPEAGPNLKTRFLKEDVLKLNLEEKFELVHSEGLMEHFYGKERILVFKKHVDFCQKDGLIIIFVPFKGAIYRLWSWFMKKINRWPYIEKPFSKEEIYQLCSKFNLKILKETNLFFELGILAKKYE